MSRYKVFMMNGEEVEVDADNFDANESRVIFKKDEYNVAYFWSKNTCGFIKVNVGEQEDERK